MHPVLASFIDLEGRAGAEVLREAIDQRRYGKRTLEFNCFDVVIDADVGTVSIEEAIGLDGARAVVAVNLVLDALRRLPN